MNCYCRTTYASITFALLCLTGQSSAVVLDDYSNYINFVEGKYTFYEVFNNPLNHTTIVDGSLAIATGWKHTAAHMWNDGERMTAPGDQVSIEIVHHTRGSTGLFLDGDLIDPFAGVEIRYYHFGTTTHFSGPWGAHHMPGPAPGDLLIQIELLSFEAPLINLRATLSGDGIDTIVEDFNMVADEVYFGPSAYWPDQTNRVDNLTLVTGAGSADLDLDGDVDDADFGVVFAAFTGPNNGPPNNTSTDLDGDGDVDDADFGIAFAAFTGPSGTTANVPEPASLALLGLGGVLLACRRH